MSSHSDTHRIVNMSMSSSSSSPYSALSSDSLAPTQISSQQVLMSNDSHHQRSVPCAVSSSTMDCQIFSSSLDFPAASYQPLSPSFIFPSHQNCTPEEKTQDNLHFCAPVSISTRDLMDPGPYGIDFASQESLQQQSSATPIGIDHDPDDDAAKFAWCFEFQSLVEKFADGVSQYSHDSSKMYDKLASLAQDFTFAARQYGKIIIMEKSLPNHLKTIPPRIMNGIAGGDKFLVNGILFKFPSDEHNLYGNVTNALKAANHDLLGCAATFASRVPGLHVPLLALIDYRGHRLTAMSFLPIHPHNTLVAGSSDAGKNIAMPRQVFENLLPLARSLNLKPHLVRGLMMCGPFDLEVHRSQRDGRLYLVDFARMFPPEAGEAQFILSEKKYSEGASKSIDQDDQKHSSSESFHALSAASPYQAPPPPSLSASNRQSTLTSNLKRKDSGKPNETTSAFISVEPEGNPCLYRMLRPELVRSNLKPLSSDAFNLLSYQDTEFAAEYHRDVFETTIRLFRSVIPNFADWLIVQHEHSARSYPFDYLPHITMHAHGINVRHLFRVLVAVLALHGPWRNALELTAHNHPPSSANQVDFDGSPSRMNQTSSSSSYQLASSASASSSTKSNPLQLKSNEVDLVVIPDARKFLQSSHPAAEWVHILIIEMLARVIKVEIREAMRSFSERKTIRDGGGRTIRGSEDEFRLLIVSFLNKYTSIATLGDHPSWGQKHRYQKQRSADIEAWDCLLKAAGKKFDFTISMINVSATTCKTIFEGSSGSSSSKRLQCKSPAFRYLPSHLFPESSDFNPLRIDAVAFRDFVASIFQVNMLYELVDRRRLFVRLQQMLNVTFRTEIWRERSSIEFWSSNSITVPLDASDVVDISEVVSDLNIVSFARAKTLHLQALSMPLESIVRLLSSESFHHPSENPVTSQGQSKSPHQPPNQLQVPNSELLIIYPENFTELRNKNAQCIHLSSTECNHRNLSTSEYYSMGNQFNSFKHALNSLDNSLIRTSFSDDPDGIFINTARVKRHLSMAISAFKEALRSSSATWIHEHLAFAYFDLARLERSGHLLLDAAVSALESFSIIASSSQTNIDRACSLPHFQDNNFKLEVENAEFSLPRYFQKFLSTSFSASNDNQSFSINSYTSCFSDESNDVKPDPLTNEILPNSAYYAHVPSSLLEELVSKHSAANHIDEFSKQSPSNTSFTWNHLLQHRYPIAAVILCSLFSNMSSWRIVNSETEGIRDIEILDSPPWLICTSNTGHIFIYHRFTFQLLHKIKFHSHWMRAIRSWTIDNDNKRKFLVSCGDFDSEIRIRDICALNNDIGLLNHAEAYPETIHIVDHVMVPLSPFPSASDSTQFRLKRSQSDAPVHSELQLKRQISEPGLKSDSSSRSTGNNVKNQFRQKVICVDILYNFIAVGCFDGSVVVHESQIQGPEFNFTRKHVLIGHFNSVQTVKTFVQQFNQTECIRVVSGSSDHTIRFWNVESGVCYSIIGSPSFITLGLPLRVMREQDIWTGHRVEHFVDQNEVKHLLCGLCAQVASKPHSLSTCKCDSPIVYCETCVWLLPKFHKCPKCKKSSVVEEFCRRDDLVNQIDSLLVCCHRNHLLDSSLYHSQNQQQRCHWVGALSDFAKHVSEIESSISHANGHRGFVQCLEVIAPWYIVSGSFDNSIRLFDLQSHSLLRVFEGHISGVWSVTSVNLPKLKLTFSDSDRDRVAATDATLEKLQLPPQTLLISGGTDSTIRLWSLDCGSCLRILSIHGGDVYSIKARVWDTKTCGPSSTESDEICLEIFGASADCTVSICRFTLPHQLHLDCSQSDAKISPFLSNIR